MHVSLAGQILKIIVTQNFQIINPPYNLPFFLQQFIHDCWCLFFFLIVDCFLFWMHLYYINLPSPCHLCSYRQAGLCVEVLPEVCCLKGNKLLVIKLHLELMKFSIQHIFTYWFDLLAFYADNWAARNLIHVATLNWFNNFEIRYFILSFIFFALLPEIWSKISEYSNWHLQG